MALLFLCNYAANAASSMTTAGFGSDASGFDPYDLITGPRSRFYKLTASTGNQAIGYSYASNLSVNYLVVARADKLLTKNGMRVKALQQNSGGTWSNIGSVDYNPLATSDLLGPAAQDLVIPISPTDLRGVALQVITKGVTNESGVLSKLYGAVSFSLGEPSMSNPGGLAPQTIESPYYFTPLEGDWPYECERRIVMTFPSVTQAKVNAFKALPQIWNWPLFLYDTVGTVWNWKLEHVLLETVQEQYVEPDQINLTLSFLRLAHYP